MANLTIKNLPDPLLKRLKNQASRHRRRLNREAIACLEASSQSVPVDPDALIARARTVRRAPTSMRLTDRVLARLKGTGRP